MKIGLYLKGFPASRPLNDGLSLAVAGLAGGLAANGGDVVVLCEGEERQSHLDPNGFMIERFPKARSAHPFSCSPSLKAYLQQQLDPRDSICVLNGMFNPGVSCLARYLRRMRIPYVVAPHDPYAPAVFQTNRHLKWPYWFLLERRLLRSAAAVQVLDERHGEFLRRLGVRTTPIIVAENGVTPDRVLPRTELRWSGPREPIRLLYLGRLDVHNKGLDLLISAFARLRSSSTTLTIQGPDEKHERGALEAQATELGVRDRIAFKAPDYDLMPGEIMRDHDVFCSPSRFEGFGLAALEAMLAARVLLVSEAAGLASHVERAGCGVVVPPDVESICSGLEDLFEMREDWPAMGSAGREYALRTLQWNAIGAELLKDYERILPKPAPRLAGLARS